MRPRPRHGARWPPSAPRPPSLQARRAGAVRGPSAAAGARRARTPPTRSSLPGGSPPRARWRRWARSLVRRSTSTSSRASSRRGCRSSPRRSSRSRSAPLPLACRSPPRATGSGIAPRSPRRTGGAHRLVHVPRGAGSPVGAGSPSCVVGLDALTRTQAGGGLLTFAGAGGRASGTCHSIGPMRWCTRVAAGRCRRQPVDAAPDRSGRPHRGQPAPHGLAGAAVLVDPLPSSSASIRRGTMRPRARRA